MPEFRQTTGSFAFPSARARSWVEAKHEGEGDPPAPSAADLSLPGLLVLTTHKGFERYDGDLKDLSDMNLFIDLSPASHGVPHIGTEPHRM